MKKWGLRAKQILVTSRGMLITTSFADDGTSSAVPTLADQGVQSVVPLLLLDLVVVVVVVGNL
jgi:hypothetical protein